MTDPFKRENEKSLSEIKAKMRDQSPSNNRLQEMEKALHLCNGRIDAIMVLRKHDRESLELFKEAQEASKKDMQSLVSRIVRLNYLCAALCALLIAVILTR